jgi:hypothetical protein
VVRHEAEDEHVHHHEGSKHEELACLGTKEQISNANSVSRLGGITSF